LITVENPLSIYEIQKQPFWRDSAIQQFVVRLFQDKPTVFEVVEVKEQAYYAEGAIIAIGWVTKETSQIVPKFDDPGVQEEVEKRWVEVKAREFAEKRAEELTAIANESKDKPLSELFADQGINTVETERFSWFTKPLSSLGTSSSQIRFGEVCEKGVARGNSDFDNKVILAPGNKFMETVYSLTVGEAGYAMNQPETVTYVIRLVGTNPPEDILFKLFTVAQYNEYIGTGIRSQQSEMTRAWMKQIDDSVGFEWVAKPASASDKTE
ncbi:MAG: hypothetical protein ACRC2T_00515, partial [Thermoguttaceae bacterium]